MHLLHINKAAIEGPGKHNCLIRISVEIPNHQGRYALVFRAPQDN